MITMAEKKTGISRDLIIHPGETIEEVLEERGITQSELASRTGVSPAYVSNVISGKKGISSKFAMGLEYALGVPKSFWLNLQANYESELLEANELQTITEDERAVRDDLKEIVKYLREKRKIPIRESKDASILSLRKTLQIHNLTDLKAMIPVGAFRVASGAVVNPNVLGAWLLLCQHTENDGTMDSRFDLNHINDLVSEAKNIMLQQKANLREELRTMMLRYGISFSIVRNFRGAPIQGYVSQKSNGIYQVVMTIRGAYADIFWFSLFHEIGHIVNGDVGKNMKLLEDGSKNDKERAADCFASNTLLSAESYKSFLDVGDFSIEAITEYASSQNVMPYIVIGRLQKEGHLSYAAYNEYKLRYKWDD